MTTQQLEVFSEAVNQAIVRMPTRRFPGVVIQGDSLSVLAQLAETVYNAVKDSPDEEFVADARELKNSLESLLSHYEAVLREHSIQLPYVRQPRV